LNLQHFVYLQWGWRYAAAYPIHPFNLADMKRITKSLIVLLSTLLFCGAAHALVPMVDRAPIAVPEGTTPEVEAKAIRRALAGRTWQVKAEQPGRIDATILVRNKHTANIEIDYDPAQIAIKYVSSTNLDYQVIDGTPMIHRFYPRWINYLMDDISKNLVRSDMQ
jgi:hypothetical protein